MVKLRVLAREFYNRDTVCVARELLGKTLVRKIGRQKLSGIITETEAYKGKNDPASHASRKMTERNKVMFGQIGKTYVYFTYGNHFMLNAVAKNEKSNAGAVLIRSIEPQEGIKLMIKNRKTSIISNLTNGPGKLTQAMNITKEQNNIDLTKNSPVFITDGIKPKKF
jgi:DNA-3-methyladenine glycosylase